MKNGGNFHFFGQFQDFEPSLQFNMKATLKYKDFSWNGNVEVYSVLVEFCYVVYLLSFCVSFRC